MPDQDRDQKNSVNLQDFNQLVKELRVEMEEQEEEDIVELFYRVYMFGNGNQEEENECQKEVPLIFMARLTQLYTDGRKEHQLLTFTDVSLVFLRAQ